MEYGIEQARRLWQARQGIGGHWSGTDVPGGWTRAIGGVGPYLGLLARGASDLEAIGEVVGMDTLTILPGVRNCIWVMPTHDRMLALQAAAGQGRKRTLRDLSKLGVDEAEQQEVAKAIVQALQGGPRNTHDLRKAIPDGVIRSLGDAGKKIGLSSTLPPVVRLMEWDGRLRRLPADGRLDSEKYLWALPERLWWDEDVLVDDQAQADALLEHYLRWAAPASLDAFLAWAKVTKTRAKKALANKGCVQVSVDGHEAWVLPDQVDDPVPEPTGVPWLLGALDNLITLRSSVGALVDEGFHGVEVPSMGSRKVSLGSSTWLGIRPVVVDGEVVGLWDWSAPDGELIAVPLGGSWRGTTQAAVDEATARMASVISDQLGGEAKMVSIDGARAQARRADFLRSMMG